MLRAVETLLVRTCTEDVPIAAVKDLVPPGRSGHCSKITQVIEWRSADVPPAERFDWWCGLIGRHMMPLRISSEHEDDYRASLKVLSLGQATVSAPRYPDLHTVRTARLIRQGGPRPVVDDADLLRVDVDRAGRPARRPRGGRPDADGHLAAVRQPGALPRRRPGRDHLAAGAARRAARPRAEAAPARRQAAAVRPGLGGRCWPSSCAAWCGKGARWATPRATRWAGRRSS
ncbi:hypothetical protein GCM10020001_116700 [Nonomuraea salmonea]